MIKAGGVTIVSDDKETVKDLHEIFEKMIVNKKLMEYLNGEKKKIHSYYN